MNNRFDDEFQKAEDDIFDALDLNQGVSELSSDASAAREPVSEARRNDPPAAEDDILESFPVDGAAGVRHAEEAHKVAEEKRLSEVRDRKEPRHAPHGVVELNTPGTVIDRGKVKEEKARKKRSGLKKAILIGLLEIITLCAIFGYAYLKRNWNMISRPKVDLANVENQNISMEKKMQMEEGYWTVAVFGVDGRSTSEIVGKGLNSDVIMVVGIDLASGDIKICSVFRDTYLNISDNNSYNKINQAYANGGPEQALAALNKNLDLNISSYVAFNWKAVVDGINILGGVDDIPISNAEFYFINAYITETVKVTKIGSVQLKKPGVHHLDGVQAVAYARLRNMDNDFARTERQKRIIKAAFDKAKKADFSVLNHMMVTCFPQVATNISMGDVVKLAQNISKYNIAGTGGFPWSRGDANVGSRGSCVIPTTLESNVKLLHEFLYGITDYEPSEAVMRYSEKIKEDSHLYKEGTVIESVRTDLGIIPRPKQTTAAAVETSAREEEYTIETDEDGRQILPTDSDGNVIYPTDEDGNLLYPTDADGNILLPQKRPTEIDPDASSEELETDEYGREIIRTPDGETVVDVSGGPGAAGNLNTNPTAYGGSSSGISTTPLGPAASSGSEETNDAGGPGGTVSESESSTNTSGTPGGMVSPGGPPGSTDNGNAAGPSAPGESPVTGTDSGTSAPDGTSVSAPAGADPAPGSLSQDSSAPAGVSSAPGSSPSQSAAPADSSGTPGGSTSAPGSTGTPGITGTPGGSTGAPGSTGTSGGSTSAPGAQPAEAGGISPEGGPGM